MSVNNAPFRCSVCHRVMFQIGGFEYDHYKNRKDHIGVSYPDLRSIGR